MELNKDIMPQHELKYGFLPDDWHEGFPLGNGELGVMCWGDGKNLKLTFDSAGAWDLRHNSPELDDPEYNYGTIRRLIKEGDFSSVKEYFGEEWSKRNPIGPTKIYLGVMDVHIGTELCSDFSLSLLDAAVRAKVSSKKSVHLLEAFVCRDRDVFCLRIDPLPEMRRLNFCPFYENDPKLAGLGHPEAEIWEENGLTFMLQQILPHNYFVLCWNSKGKDVFIAYSKSDVKQNALQDAAEKHKQAITKGFESLKKEHVGSWKDFWRASAVVLPEKKMEFLWYFGLYMLSSSARKGSNPPGLQGVWAKSRVNAGLIPWQADYHADMNVQETFWPACPGNHIELIDVWLDFIYETIPVAERYTRKVFGTEGAFQLCSFFPEHVNFLGPWTTCNFTWSHTGFLAHLAWLRWRYTMDKKWLLEKGYPVMKSAFLFYSSNLEKEEDGRLHIPLSTSPEYGHDRPEAWSKDPNIDIALIRKCCDWIIEMEQALGINEYSARASEILYCLVEYHLVEHVQFGKVLGLWKDKPLDEAHLHPSHLMAIHPAMDFTIDGSEKEKALIEKSLKAYLALGQDGWAGHTFAQMISMASVTGHGEMAYGFLLDYHDTWILPNGLYINMPVGVRKGAACFQSTEDMYEKASFTMEASCGVSCGISDMLLQGWGGKIRVFPAVPDRWTDLLFVNLLTEGAFNVSALKKNGRVCWVRITARVTSVCRLVNPFDRGEYRAKGQFPKQEGSLLSWHMSGGETVEIFAAGFDQIDMNKESRRIRDLNIEWLKLKDNLPSGDS